jgi:cytochrome b involved in lipid metabolism
MLAPVFSYLILPRFYGNINSPSLLIIMRLELTLGIIGIVIIIFLVGYYIGTYNHNQELLNNSTTSLPTNSANLNANANTIVLNSQTISQHNRASDCWLVINNKVYDVTKFLSQHPGGSGIIVPYCGGEATTAFATQGGRGSHSGVAAQDLNSLFIGNLGGTTTTETIQRATNAAANLNPYQEEDDDD